MIEKRKKIVFVYHPEWAFGRIHTDLIKFLWNSGFDCDFLPGNILYTIEEIIEFDKSTDLFISAFEGWPKLFKPANINPNKCIFINHGRDDFLYIGEINEIINEAYGYACVSNFLTTVSDELGVIRKPKVLQLGLNYNKFYGNVSDKLEVVGYAGTQQSDNKRFSLIQRCVEAAGLKLKVAQNYHRSFVTMPGFYHNVDAIMTASFEEGAGLPTLEGGSAGKLLLSTNVGHWNENMGITLPFDENEYFEKAVESLVYYKNNPIEYRKYCTNSQKYFSAYDWSVHINDWIEFLK